MKPIYFLFSFLAVASFIMGCASTSQPVTEKAVNPASEKETPKKESTMTSKAPAKTTEPEAPASKDSVKTTASGLQYVDLIPGTGKFPEKGQMVIVHYTGWLTDGTKFDSSVDRGSPFRFPLGAGRVIQGWDEGVAGMKIGGKRKLIIPSNLGYGASGAGATIPPNATLVFEVELLGVQ